MRGEYQPYFVTADEISVINDNETVVKNGTLRRTIPPIRAFIYARKKCGFMKAIASSFRTLRSMSVRFRFSGGPTFINRLMTPSASWSLRPSLVHGDHRCLPRLPFRSRTTSSGRVRLDYRSRRGVAIGFESDMNYGKDKDSFAKLKTYFLHDQNPDLNRTSCRAASPEPRVIASRCRTGRISPSDTLRDSQYHQAERSVCPPGFFPERVPDRSAAGQRRRADEDRVRSTR